MGSNPTGGFKFDFPINYYLNNYDMNQSKLPKKLVIRDSPNTKKYIQGKNSDKVTLTFKIFMRKRQSRASKTLTLNTTLDELRKQRIVWWEAPIHSSFTNLIDQTVIYIARTCVISSFLKLFQKMGVELKIPKKFNYNIDFYSDSIYDVLLTSTRPYNLPIN